MFDGFLFDSRDINNSIKILDQIKNVKKPKLLDAEENTTSELLTYFSHVVFSYQGLKSFTGLDDIESALIFISKRFNCKIFVTNGEYGCYYLNDNVLINIPATKIKPKDTLAAGDIWHGAFLLKLVSTNSLKKCIEFANHIASLKCKKFGGSSGAPFASEIKDDFK